MTSIRVLLVEDEADIRALLAELLCHEGYEVIEATDGDQAVALIDGPHGFDLLLTDVQMPGLVDGIQVAAYARQRYPNLPVIVISAQPSNAQRLEGLGSRSVFLGKPYRLNTLLEMMRRMLAEPVLVRGKMGSGGSTRTVGLVGRCCTDPPGGVRSQRDVGGLPLI